ncbi:MAG: hypothetical protein CK533_08960 [Acidobacterium sp.]|nr:hypothetical protein [Acidobacteriota bacterium]PHY10593.1 MAG: hypothetical protein CK533_08960 [Acidobacterium sp.]
MRRRSLGILAALALSVVYMAGQAPATPDTSKIGPQVGATVPAFEGTDQFGKPHTLASAYGPKGAMLVFFRSADW